MFTPGRLLPRLSRFQILLLSKCALTVALCSVLSIPFSIWIGSRTLESHVEAARFGLVQEANVIQAAVWQEAKNPDYAGAIAAGDLRRLRILVGQAAKKTGAEFSIADAAGTALARSEVENARGDVVSVSTSWGRAFRAGLYAASFATGSAYPLILVSSAPLRDADATVGALFARQIINNQFAEKFQQNYLDLFADVVFFDTRIGVIASSFSDQKGGLKKQIESFIVPTHVSKIEYIPERFRFGASSYYTATVPLPATESSFPGAMLIMVSIKDSAVALIFAAFATLFFLLFDLILYRFVPWITRRQDVYSQEIAFASMLLVTAFVSSWLTIHYSTPLPIRTLEPIYNSTMSLSPETRIITAGSEFSVDLDLTTGGEEINAVEASVLYDPQTVVVKDVVMDHSFCPSAFVIERTFDNDAGIASVACVVPGGISPDSASVLATLVLEPRSVGAFSLRFASSTSVLANDGLGTNVLRETTDGSYSVISGTSSIALFSPTHPNSERWYNTTSVQFYWDEPEGETADEYQLHSSIVPSTEWATTTSTSVLIEAPGDGTYYFHLREADGSLAVPYKIQIDSMPPPPPTLRASGTAIKAGEVVRLELENSDTAASKRSGFYLRINDGILLPVGDKVVLPFPKKGVYRLTAQVFDVAENASQNSLIITVE